MKLLTNSSTLNLRYSIYLFAFVIVMQLLYLLILNDIVGDK